MKVLKSLFSAFIMFLFCCNYMLAQCGDCNYDENIFEISDGVYGGAIAQSYFWEVCSGNATIVGSNTNQSATVLCNGSGSATLKVTRFYQGSCIESCINIECPPPSCPPESCLNLNYQGNPQKCVQAWINFDPSCLEEYNCGNVQLKMTLAGIHTKIFPVGATSGAWDLPDGNWNGTQLKGFAEVSCGGQFCEIYTFVDLDCYVKGGNDDGFQYLNRNNDNDEGSFLSESNKVSANKNGDQVSFAFNDNEVIESIRVYNIDGQIIDVSLDKSTNTINLNSHFSGILKAIISTDKGVYYSTFYSYE